MTEQYEPATVAVAAGRPHDPGDPLNAPISASSTFRAGGDRRYGRSGTETWEAFEEAIGALEGGVAVSFASGLAAVVAALELAPAGGVVAAESLLYIGSRQLLEDLERRGRVSVVRFRGVDDPVLASADLVLVEDPTNPGLSRVDIDKVAAAAPQALVVVDNTVATPIAHRPLEMGADVVVHSATKYLGGHSDLLMGAVVVSNRSLEYRLRDYRLLHGAVPGMLESFLALRGIRTLAVRMERAVANAAEIATRLGSHSKVVSALHPGVGALVALEVAGGPDAADEFIDRLRLWVHATSLGGVESTLERRARWDDEGSLVSDTLIRMSVGIENVEDLWADLAQALEDTPVR